MRWWIALGIVLVYFVAPWAKPYHLHVFWAGEAILGMTFMVWLAHMWRVNDPWPR